MITDEILDYTRKKIRTVCDHTINLSCLIVIGSLAYPEFSRENSDIDLIALHSGTSATYSDYLILEVAPIGGRERLVELRLLPLDAFLSYVLTCDIAQLFAFVRGFDLIRDTDLSEGGKVIDVALSRYFSDASKVFSDMKKVGFSTHIENTRFFLSDAKNSLSSKRVRDQRLLCDLRIGEVTKDFIALVWTAMILRRYGKVEVLEVNPDNEVLKEVGLLRVLMALRGARMVDEKKYPKPADVSSMIRQVNKLHRQDVDLFFKGLHAIFRKVFEISLFIDQSR